MSATASPKPLVTLAPKVETAKTTKVLVGVDSTDGYVPAVDLVSRLKFQKPRLSLVHVANLQYPLEGADAHTEAEYSRVVENIGLRALDRSVDEACRRDLQAKTSLRFGRVADVMIHEADAIGADLVAIRALKHGTWSSGYLGSATCALATNSTKSLLVAKKPIEHHRSLRAILAVDHSIHTPEILWKFIQLAPIGISEILVLTCYSIDDQTSVATHKNLPMLGGLVDEWLVENLSKKNDYIVQLLSEHGYKARSKVVNAPVEDGIRVSMQDYRADLLVIGSVGNGSVEGAKIGSIALNEITAEPFSVLMLR